MSYGLLLFTLAKMLALPLYSKQGRNNPQNTPKKPQTKNHLNINHCTLTMSKNLIYGHRFILIQAKHMRRQNTLESPS